MIKKTQIIKKLNLFIMNPHTIILPATVFTHHHPFIAKTEVLGEKPVPVPLCPSQYPHTGLRLNPGLHGDRPATNSLSNDVP
jgi:hypothetical protein